MPLTRKLDVQGAIFGVWCMFVLVNAHQFDDTFDPLTRRALVAGTQGGLPVDPGQQPPGHNFKVVDVSKYPPALGDGKTDSTPVIINVKVSPVCLSLALYQTKLFPVFCRV